jgi:hypothetical protein
MDLPSSSGVCRPPTVVRAVGLRQVDGMALAAEGGAALAPIRSVAAEEIVGDVLQMDVHGVACAVGVAVA